MKKIIYTLVAVIVIIILGYAIVPKSNTNIQDIQTADQNANQNASAEINTTQASATVDSAVATSSTISGVKTKTYSLDEVSKHSTAKDCWIAVNGKVYDATKFIASGQHNSKILQGCGKDASAMFASVRKHQGNQAQSILPTLFIGELK